MKYIFKNIMLTSILVSILVACGSGGSSGNGSSNPQTSANAFTANIWFGNGLESQNTLIITKGQSPLGGYDIKATAVSDGFKMSASGCTLNNPTTLVCPFNSGTLTYNASDYSVTLDSVGTKYVYYKPGHIPQESSIFTANQWLDITKQNKLIVTYDGNTYKIDANFDGGNSTISNCKLANPSSIVCPYDNGTLTYRAADYSVTLKTYGMVYTYYNPDHMP